MTTEEILQIGLMILLIAGTLLILFICLRRPKSRRSVATNVGDTVSVMTPPGTCHSSDGDDSSSSGGDGGGTDGC